MRLLNASTLLVEEFIGTDIPAYAILSHTWGDEEVSFKDMTTEPSCKSKKGYAKILISCNLATADGLQYVWIDTCCIDKTSSAELTEAINSMYQWYGKAERCYAYLVDLEPSPAWEDNLAHCRWFTRGWTLQELIAPSDIYFYDKEWNKLFRKREGISVLASITGVDSGVLGHWRSLASISVAQRMSWASRRTTTRVEDEAYCLLGIFDVNMPMLYGEGRKAFMRLQEEIVRICPDLSIFAWRNSVSPDMDSASIACSIFATTAAYFTDSGSFLVVNASSTNDFFISNQGIKLHTRMPLEGIPKQQGYRYVFPVCRMNDGSMLGIRLRKCGASQLVREDPGRLYKDYLSFPSLQSRTMYLMVRLPPEQAPNYFIRDMVVHSRSHILQIVLPPEIVVNNSWPWARWDVTEQVFFVSDNVDLDYAAAKLSGVFDIGTLNKSINAHFDFMLYSLGWADTGSKKPRYTIIPWKPSDGVLKDFNDKLEQYDYTTTMVDDDLSAYDISMYSTAQFVLADSGYIMTVTCSPDLVNDDTKCLHPFWRLTLSWKVDGSPR